MKKIILFAAINILLISCEKEKPVIFPNVYVIHNDLDDTLKNISAYYFDWHSVITKPLGLLEPGETTASMETKWNSLYLRFEIDGEIYHVTNKFMLEKNICNRLVIDENTILN